jgi:hypothetical protein
MRTSGTLSFGGDHLNDLAPASDQIGEKLAFLQVRTGLRPARN